LELEENKMLNAGCRRSIKPALGFSNPQTTLAFDNTEEQTDAPLETDKPAPHHLLIEGDNLPVLTALSYTHEGLIDVIYIDPPYNTGNKDFRYNDRFVDKEDPYRHSKWLSFMHKRLILAKRLLKSTGVIFISIDDNEQANLKLLCDEVFDEKNFIADVIWQSRKSVSNDTFISLAHNHTLVFANNLLQKDKNDFRLPIKSEKFENPDKDTRGAWVADPFDAPNLRPNLTYPIMNPNTNESYLPPKGRCWRTTEKEYLRFLEENRIIFGKNGKSKPQFKRFLSEAETKGSVTTTIWNDIETTTNGTQLLEQILEDKLFNNPKPLELINRILQLTTKENNKTKSTPSVILDFFAGSGTTLHAVMQLNAEDGGNRQCILVTNNENNIAEEVCYERNKRVINGYVKPNGTAVKGLTDNHLHYYEQTWFDEAADATTDGVYEHSHIRLGRLMREMLMIKEACFEDIEAAILRGYHPDLVFTDDNHPDLDVLESADKYLVIIYTDDAIADGVKIIEALPNAEKKVVVYPFEYQNAPDLSPYEHLTERTIVVNALPSSYKATYDHILEDLRKRRRRFVISDEDVETVEDSGSN
jgi:adenine-specific DNA-methyltransferase